MIKTPTTFVVGAGASKPYGLPVASELHQSAKTMGPDSHAYQLLLQSVGPEGVDWPPILPEALNEVLEDLRWHPAPSIDAFLESRQDAPETMRIGRALIAALMARALADAASHQTAAHEDWLAYVVERLRRGAARPRDFARGNANVKFVTFNFDTVVEDRLSRAIGALYRGASASEIDDAVRSCSVIHVHGRLPPLPDPVFAPDPMDGFSPAWRRWIAPASAQVNVVLDTIDDTVLSAAHQAMSSADVICFLGFAYDPGNLAHLGVLPGVPARGSVYGSAFLLSDGERSAVEGRVRGIQLSDINAECVQTLRKFHIFRD